MTVQRYALIDTDGKVVNVVLWDGDTKKWRAPSGLTAVQSDAAGIDDTYADGTFTPPTPQP